MGEVWSLMPLVVRDLYRLPWSLSDNPISWLEPTKNCNLACFGCYSANRKGSHKTLEEIEKEIDLFIQLRNPDGISIAGGDPLTHPQICDIVRMVSKKRVKPVINTNGLALTPSLLKELKKAGVAGFTFHIDSKQGRPKWKNKNEIEHNELRQIYADMLAGEGGLSCAFNSTVYEDTLHHVPGILSWARQNIDRVHVVVFILFRAAASPERFDYLANGIPTDVKHLVYGDDQGEQTDMTAHDIYHVIKLKHPELEPCAYLSGTADPQSLKWTISTWIGTKEKIFGSVGGRFMELTQTFYHLWKGRYLAYVHPKVLRRARVMMLLLGVIERSLARIFFRWVGWVLKNPLRILKKCHLQSVLFIQPIDLMENGAQNMCDGCPDMTLYKGNLIWSCRLEEQMNYGAWLQTIPKLEHSEHRA